MSCAIVLHATTFAMQTMEMNVSLHQKQIDTQNDSKHHFIVQCGTILYLQGQLATGAKSLAR